MANGDAGIPQTTLPLEANVQAHLAKASRFADGLTRNWSLFFFFRILPEAELALDLDRLAKFIAARNAGQDSAKEEERKLLAAWDRPAAENASADAPAGLFLDWLKVITGPQSDALANTLREKLVEAGLAHAVAGPVTGHMAPALQSVMDSLRQMPAMVSDPDKFRAVLASFGKNAGEAGLMALRGGLSAVCFYELLRQIAPAQVREPNAQLQQRAVMRSAAAEKVSRPNYAATEGGAEPAWDPVPINFAFTYSGLKALKLDETTLASFPDAFKEGMAARAERLGDTGPCAPEHWEGVLGLDRVHGYFTGGFLVGSKKSAVPDILWQRLRDDVRAFNDGSDERGRQLRARIRTYFKLLGMDILQIELGEDPYEVDEQGNVQRMQYRREHFGFRDGISQPFVDLKLGNPAPGGGTPRRNRAWSPLAAGEIYLDQPDEDGNLHQLPAHELLRRGSTFLVFRKLEQDVVGFRAFLAKQRPGNREAQRRLAAQFVGRWPNGTPLVLAPDAPLDLGRDPDSLINDFLYAEDDATGLKCPLSSHVRRTNPRDIGGTNDVRRHRILRRGIGYGGPLLPEKALGDGNKRGLLFVAANSRIDLQFETIQGWMNKGELLGQAGLNRCPIAGANLGGVGDAFLEAGAAVPVTGLPRFVITRGGDYFFAPGVAALKAIAEGFKFPVTPASLPYLGHSMADAKAPGLFSEERLTGYGARILAGQPSVIRVAMPPSAAGAPAPKVAFVGQFRDVKHVLSMKLGPPGAADPKVIHSVAQYHAAVERLSLGRDMLVSTELGSDSESTRRRMYEILNEAWKALGPNIYPRLAAITKSSIEATLAASTQSGRIDLVNDLASVAVYDVLVKLYGTPGPTWLTEMAVALPFSHQHVGDLPRDWLAGLKTQAPDNVGWTSLQLWSILMFVDIVGNYEQQPELMALSRQAASEFLTHLSTLLARARARQAPPQTNLLAAFVHLEGRFVKQFGYSPAAYYTDVRMLLLEMVGTTVANIPATFAAVMDAVFKFNIRLPELMPILLQPPVFSPPGSPLTAADKDGVGRLIYETCRLNGVAKVLMRTCMQADTLPSGGKIQAGDLVAALVAAASLDKQAFPDPRQFSLHPFLPGPERNVDNYLLFGAKADVAAERRDCWGRGTLALYLLKECVKAAGRLQHLQRVAGEAGKPKVIARLTTGLPARFSAVLPDWGS